MVDCCVFAGQGAQVPGMGRDFATQDALAESCFEKANHVLGFDLKKICFEGPQEELTKSNICQPAIFVTSYVAYQAFQKAHPTSFTAAAGLSLGEWGALCVAGVLDFDETLTVLEARGRFMQEACAATPSGMIAIVGASAEQLKSLCDQTQCTPANINSATQVVLSGNKAQIAQAVDVAKALGIKRAIPLQTSGAFHSKFMQSAREKLAPILDQVTFKKPLFPVISNVTGRLHSSDPSEIKDVMLRQVTETTRWADDIETAKSLGCTRFIEFGPGKVLSGLIKKIDANLITAQVNDLATLNTTLALCANNI